MFFSGARRAYSNSIFSLLLSQIPKAVITIILFHCLLRNRYLLSSFLSKSVRCSSYFSRFDPQQQSSIFWLLLNMFSSFQCFVLHVVVFFCDVINCIKRWFNIRSNVNLRLFSLNAGYTANESTCLNGWFLNGLSFKYGS